MAYNLYIVTVFSPQFKRNLGGNFTEMSENVVRMVALKRFHLSLSRSKSGTVDGTTFIIWQKKKKAKTSFHFIKKISIVTGNTEYLWSRVLKLIC